MAATRRFPRLLVLSLGLALAALPARAQLDPRLQVTKTDFLDLFQQTNSSALKPEIATIFDFSGSTQALMYSALFNNQDKDDADPSSNVVFTRTGTSPGPYGAKASLSAYTYDPTRPTGTGVALPLTFVALVRPDGTTVTAANVDTTVSRGLPGDTASPRSSDIRNWIRAASHVRFSAPDPGNANLLRTVDVPIPWKIMDRTSTGYPLSSKMAQDLPVQAGTTHTGLAFEMDTCYSNTSSTGGNVLSNSATNSTLTLVAYHRSYTGWLFMGRDLAGKYFIPDAVNPSISELGAVAQGFANGVPAENRSQTVKEAAIRTWIDYQDKVYWAYRFLNVGGEQNQASNVFTDTRTDYTAGNINTARVAGNDRAWTLLNANSTAGIQRIAALFAGGSTPLTYAVGNAYAQFNDPNSVFNDVEKGVSKPLDCMKHFLIVFTDGQPNNDGNPTPDTPYLDPSPATTGSADAGNNALIGFTSNLNPNTAWWNVPTLAAVAAHGGDTNLPHIVRDPTSVVYPAGTYPVSSNTTPDAIAPFFIQSRGTGADFLKYNKPHPIQTMTVGLSLGGNFTDPTSGKARLFQSAVFGDPAKTSWDVAVATPFTLSTPGDPTSTPTPNSVYFFDGRDPQAVIDGLGIAFAAAGAITGTNAASAPTTPPVGLSLSNQVYLGTFTPPKNGGPVWSGDLFMYSTYTTSTNTYLIDNTGNAISQPTATNAQWAASTIFTTGGKKWSQRNIWTRLPATSGTPNPGLIQFQDQTQNSTNYTALKPYVGPSTYTDIQRNALMDYVMGADTSSPGPAYTNRGNIMGDIVDSAPSSLEYNWSQYKASIMSKSSILGAAAGGIPATSTPHFRLIFVGDNQSYLHAFGELSWSTPIQVQDPSFPADPTKKITIPVTHGAVDELWAFLPTDFLANLNYLTDPTHPHRFMVDGTAYPYLLDLPASNAISGNGVVDNSPVQERAMVIFGLRKGGRSYYALDVSDPTTPKLGPAQSAAGWAIQPDNASLISASSVAPSTTLANVQKVVGTMGYSSSQPFVGRVLYDGGGVSQTIRDAVFLGGGFSTPDMDAQNLNTSTSIASSSPLGRSALAVDVNTGQYLMTWDLTTTSFWNAAKPNLVGPVAAGVVPFSMNLSSGLVSRAYFNDFGGNLWAVGSTLPGAAPFTGFRNDTNVLDHWTADGNAANGANKPSIRLVYTQSGTNNGILNSLPAPFLIGGFPVVRTNAPKVAPFAVGVAVNTGDRNNPLDRAYDPTTNPKPTQHRVTVVFDRQDSSDLGLDATGIQTSQLVDFTAQNNPTAPAITEGNPSFYLNSAYGYYINYPGLLTAFVNKAINDPLVVSYALFFSYFSPDFSDPCTGGTGQTISSRVTDVLHPYFPGFSSTPVSPSSFKSGVVAVYSGVATNYSAQGTGNVTQGGTVPTPGGPNKTGLAIFNISTNPSQRFPRPRTWRVVR